MRLAFKLSLLGLLALPQMLPALAEPINLPVLLKNGSIRVETESGEALLRHRDDELFVPASIIKVATAFCALQELNANYRFSTEFLLDDKNTLFVRASGDPTMISEELSAIAQAIAKKTGRINEIIIDTSLFSSTLTIDGASSSLNPYDAKNSAFVGNFSSAYLTRTKTGAVTSAEPQTPLTPLSRKAGLKLKRGTTARIKIGEDWKTGALYGGELLSEFLTQAGLKTARRITLGPISSSARTLLIHTSSQNLTGIITGMLKHSTNFTANQLFLTLGVKRFGAPATLKKAQQALTECLSSRVGWSHFHIEEGSGLSRKNQVSAHLMTTLLKKFEPYSDLLPEEDAFRAKTGSLNGVNSLAGYFELPKFGRLRFAIIINSNVPHLYKFKVASAVRNYLNLQPKEAKTALLERLGGVKKSYNRGVL